MNRKVYRDNGDFLKAILHYDGGYFSLTGETKHTGGCIHADIVQQWPDLAPAAAIHLGDSETGEPMHAYANGLYWLQGCRPDDTAARYHGGSGSDARTPAACRAMLIDHLRCTGEQAAGLVAAFPADIAAFSAAVHEMGLPAQWRREAAELREFINKQTKGGN